MTRPVLVAVVLLGAAAGARGQDACSAEVQRLCPASRGDTLLLSCMRAHEAEFNKVCKGDPDALLARAKKIGSACDGDVSRLCKDVQPGEGRVVSCLRDNESSLSQSCQSAFNQWRLTRMELTSVCAGDVGKFCQSIPEGSGRIVSCLREHEKELDSSCRSALQKL